MLRRILNWLSLQDYQIAKAETTRNTIYPPYMDEAALQRLSREGDKAMHCLMQKTPKTLHR